MKSHIAFILSSLLIFLITTTISASDDGNKTDYQALLQFKSMMIGDPLSSWNTSFHFCDWRGVSCGRRHRRVTALQLSSQGLAGSLSPHVGNLSFLRVIYLRNNSFRGTIPHELGRLFRLRILHLDSNKFNGVIPTNLSHCSNIEELVLDYNKLVGSIPKEISFLSKLTLLSVEANVLTGTIPAVLGNITSMKLFYVAGNPLGGSIPDTLGQWKSLTQLYLGDCNLNGTIPHSIYNLSLLTEFSLPQNQITGSLPSALGAMLSHLVHLYVWGNQMNGLFPPSISNCSKLQYFDVGDNNFTWKAIDFAKLKHIIIIDLEDTIYGSQEAGDMKFIDSFINCSKLEGLGLRNCKLQGVLPRSVGNFSDQLNILDLAENRLYGNLPSSIGNLVGLTALGISRNRFIGKLPSTISKLQNLQIADLSINQFSGPIPHSIDNLSLLTELFLYSNRLEGTIPSSLGNCHHLLWLDLNNNKLSGKIPKSLLQLSSLSIALDLSQNNLSGSLPTQVGELKMLTYLNLSDNKLSGNIPSTIGGCTSLVVLSLKGNLFQGMVPSTLTSMRGVDTLDISHNNLSGRIPQFLKRFSFKYVDLSFNDFEGEVPVMGVFANASAFSVLGNSKICGGLPKLGLPKCREPEKHKKRFPLFIIIILIASTIFTVSCLVYAWCKKSRRQPSQSSKDGQFMKVSYSQLLKATNGFTEANLIGEGGLSSVYRGILHHDDRFVAIKVLHLQNRGAHKSFIAECEAWRNIRHRNLLKIITSCSSVDYQGNDFKALVYEYMPNGSLHSWLHASASTSRLNLLQRINILIDVASAIDYLHNHCLPTIVHCDLKPSNILLDDDMLAHVGDFGLARFLGTNSNKNSTSGVRGTIGYTPPEYGVGGEMTTSGDVYSFGIVLLEVMTGKRPTNDIFNEGLSLHKFAHMALPDHVTDVIDDELLNFFQEDAIATKCKLANATKIEECLVLTVKIGVSCCMESPQERINIENVVHELQHVQDMLQKM